MNKTQSIVNQILQKRVLTHLLFWLFIILIAPLTSNGGIGNMGEAFLFRIMGLPVKILATYFFVYYQVGKLFQKKKYLRFILSFFLSIAVFAVLDRSITIYVSETLINSSGSKESLMQIVSELEYTYVDYFFRIYFFVFTFLFIKMVKNSAEEKRKIETLQQEKTTAELNFLRTQIHPHFLFNTLNNLYALTLEKSEKAPDVVAKLAEILDYMLYRCQGNAVLIEKEVETLKHYIALEKLRYGDRLELSFDYDTDNTSAEIAPLLLISVVENAFKHGVSGAIHPPKIMIDLLVKSNKLHFKVYNTKANLVEEESLIYAKGIGMKNIKRQLELIYQDAYGLDIKENDFYYEVNLELVC